MDFQQLADVAEKWCSSTPFELIAAEETERRMDFYADPGVSFYVLCPDNGCGDSFVSTRDGRALLRPSSSRAAGWGRPRWQGARERRCGDLPDHPALSAWLRASQGSHCVAPTGRGSQPLRRDPRSSPERCQSPSGSQTQLCSRPSQQGPLPSLRVPRTDTKPLSTPAMIDLLDSL